jgi:hypothetical protein
MNEFWDDLIERKYNNRSRFFDLHIIQLTKFKSGDYNQYFGYGPNYDFIVNVCYYQNEGGSYIGLGKGITENEADDMVKIKIYVESELNDTVILNILKSHYNWKISNFFDLCS